MAAAIATLSVLHKEGLPAQAEAKGDYTLGRLRALQAKYPALIREVRGRGLMIGLEFVDNETGYEFARGAFARRVVISGTLVNAKTIRVEPPLTISYEQVSGERGVQGVGRGRRQDGCYCRQHYHHRRPTSCTFLAPLHALYPRPQLDTVLARFDDALAEMAAARGLAPVVVTAPVPPVTAPSAPATAATDSWLASCLDQSGHISKAPVTTAAVAATMASPVTASPSAHHHGGGGGGGHHGHHHAAGRPHVVPHSSHHHHGGGGGGPSSAAGIAAPPPLFSHGTTTTTTSSANASPKAAAVNGGGGYRVNARAAAASSGGGGGLSPLARPKAAPSLVIGAAPTVAVGSPSLAPVAAAGSGGGGGVTAPLTPMSPAGGDHDAEAVTTAFKLDAASGGGGGGSTGDASSSATMATTPSGDSPGGGAAATATGPARPPSAAAFVT
jgi:hypothetical protein